MLLRQQVDLARLQRGEALLRGQRHIFDLVGVAEDRRRQCPADVDIEAGLVALVVGLRRNRRGRSLHAAADLAGLLDLVERRPGLRRNPETQHEADRGERAQPTPDRHPKLPVPKHGTHQEGWHRNANIFRLSLSTSGSASSGVPDLLARSRRPPEMERLMVIRMSAANLQLNSPSGCKACPCIDLSRRPGSQSCKTNWAFLQVIMPMRFNSRQALSALVFQSPAPNKGYEGSEAARLRLRA